MKKFISVILALVMVLALVGCGSQSANSDSSADNSGSEKYNLIIGTGGVGGTYYPLGGALASVWTKYLDNVTVSAQSTGASVENTQLLENGEV